MADFPAARFAAARDRHGPLAIGADPHGQVLGKWGLADDADGLERFTDIVLSAAAGPVGLIKPQSAFYLGLAAIEGAFGGALLSATGCILVLGWTLPRRIIAAHRQRTLAASK